MPRALWSGTISFGLVGVPVKMFSAVAEHTLRFHLVHAKDDGPIGYRKVCKLEDRPVPDEEIVKAFEVAKGEYVHLTDEDFEAAPPQEGSERVYALLRRALEDAELAGIATFVMRDREHLGCIRMRAGVLTLEQMYFADEIRPADDLAPKSVKVDRRELEMAARLIESFSGSFDPERYRDQYRDAVAGIIKAKQKGEEVHAAPAEEPEEPGDLLEALRASIEARSGARKGRRRDRLGDLSRDELYERAKAADVAGRSQMSKDELVDALRHPA
jgi:DNA end-binding protein Ku